MEFKVGDKVIILGTAFESLKPVYIGLVSEVDSLSLCKVVKTGNTPSDTIEWWYFSSELMLYSEYRLKVELGLMEPIGVIGE